MTSNVQNILQRRLFLNAIEIQELEQHINIYRQRKTTCDEEGLLEAEYQHHNALKYLRGELAKFVDEQRYIKATLKSLKKPKISKKHRKGEPKPMDAVLDLVKTVAQINLVDYPKEAIEKAFK